MVPVLQFAVAVLEHGQESVLPFFLTGPHTNPDFLGWVALTGHWFCSTLGTLIPVAICLLCVTGAVARRRAVWMVVIYACGSALVDYTTCAWVVCRVVQSGRGFTYGFWSFALGWIFWGSAPCIVPLLVFLMVHQDGAARFAQARGLHAWDDDDVSVTRLGMVGAAIAFIMWREVITSAHVSWDAISSASRNDLLHVAVEHSALLIDVAWVPVLVILALQVGRCNRPPLRGLWVACVAEIARWATLAGMALTGHITYGIESPWGEDSLTAAILRRSLDNCPTTLMLGVLAGYWAFRLRRHPVVIRHGGVRVCARCGYTLMTTGSRCSECGALVAPICETQGRPPVS